MEETELKQILDRLEKKIDAAYASAEKARKYILATIIVSIIVFVLPLVGLLFAIPSFISTYSQIGGF